MFHKFSYVLERYLKRLEFFIGRLRWWIEWWRCRVKLIFSRRNIIQEFGNLLDEIHFAYMFVLPVHIFKDVCMADIVLIASRCIMDYPLTIPNRHTFDAFKETLVLEFFSIEKRVFIIFKRLISIWNTLLFLQYHSLATY